MERNESMALTQDELVAGLQALGYTDVTKRRVASWRKEDLLPPFDLVGGGRGRRRGRAASGWRDAAQVKEQAAWVYELLKTYDSFDELYLPLWMLGFDVPMGRVREALGRPLEATAHSVEVVLTERDDVNLEDVIDDIVDDFDKFAERTELKVFKLPADSLAALANIILNGDYDVADSPFDEGVRQLEEWEERCAEFFGDDVATAASAADPKGTLWTIFTHAPFINTYLSLQPLSEAVDMCTDDDLIAVQGDLRAGREIVLQAKRLLDLLTPYIPEYMRPAGENDLRTVFSFGKLCIWADLSLRRGGWGELIDYLLPLTAGEIRAQFTEEVERQIRESGPQITLAIEEVVERLCAPFGGRECLMQ